MGNINKTRKENNEKETKRTKDCSSRSKAIMCDQLAFNKRMKISQGWKDHQIEYAQKITR